MKILLLHSDFISYEPKKKAIKAVEAVKKGKVFIEEALVVFSGVEKKDEENGEKIINNAVKEILDVYKQVKAEHIVIYPFVHLTREPASPAAALHILKGIEKKILDEELSVKRAPFGWYKGFTVKCKGHPLAELSRDIDAEGSRKRGEVSEAVEKEKELKSEWFIVEPGGKKHKIRLKDGKVTGFNFSRHEKLKKLVLYEMAKSRAMKEEPPHIGLMRKLEIADYEKGSDPGHFRYFPKGKMMKALIEEWVNRKVLEYGAMEVETPIMYDLEHPALKDYMNRFPARQYAIKTPNKRVFLRFAACFGQFLMAHDASISYRNLPLRIYELTRYSFRVEQRGELAGLRRLRAFTMPDTHAMCADVEEAKEEMLTRFDLCGKCLEGCGIKKKDDIEFALRMVKDFYKKNAKFVNDMVKRMGKPALLEVWDKKFFYFVMKHEWNFIDALDKAATLSTDQIDVENAERYGMKFQDKDNKQKFPVVLHCSPSGAIERVIYALLENAYMEQQKGKNPVFPLWLSPTQVRLCPVSDKFLKYTEKIADGLEKENVRVDIDDRTESIGKKVRNAETEWVNMIVVIGEREKKSGSLAVRFRETGKVKGMKKEEIAGLVKKETKVFPSRPLPLPRLLSRRVVFFG